MFARWRVAWFGFIAVLPSAALPISPLRIGTAPVDGQRGPELSSPTSISLAGLGYRDGIDFTGYEGRRDLFFRVPTGPWLKSLHLSLSYDAIAAGSGRRTLTVMTGGRTLGQIAVSGPGVVEIPVPPDALANGGLGVTLLYSGGESGNRCLDRRVGADHFHLDPKSGLTLDTMPATTLPVAVAAALVHTQPTVFLPASPNARQAAAALTVIAARGGGTLALGQQAAVGAGNVRIDGEADPALRSIEEPGSPGLAIGGKDPAAAARAAFSQLADLLDAPVIERATLLPHRPETLHFADLGADPRAAEIADEGGWMIALPASRFPKGKTVRGLAIDIAAVPDGSPRAASVSAWMNGVLLGSTPLDSTGTTELKVAVPPAVLHSLNGIEVRITRQNHADCGDTPRGWPVQLLGSSEVLLGDAGDIEDFHDFAAAAGQGVTIVVPGPAALPLVGRAVPGLISRDVPIAVSYGAIPAVGPVIYVGATPPAGTQPPLLIANGRMHLAARTGEADIDLPDAGAKTVVQLLDRDGRPILWLRPASAAAVPASLWLDQGDVALAAADGTITSLSSRRDRLAALIGPAPPPPWWRTHEKWVFAAFGLLIGLAIIVWSFRPSIKRARPGQDI